MLALIMDALAALMPSAFPSIALMACVKDLILVNIAINMQIAMLEHIANKKTPGHMPQSATKLIPTSSSALTHTNVVHLHTVGMCLKKIEKKMFKSVCHYIHKKKELQWDGSQIIHLQTLQLMITRLMVCIANLALLFLSVKMLATAQLQTILYTIVRKYNSHTSVTPLSNQLGA